MPIVKTNQLTIKKLNDLQDSNYVGKTLLDGNNLYIKKIKTGLFWHYRVAFNSNTGYKASWLSLGSYPSVSIATARNKALKVRELIEQGINPKTAQAKLSDRLGKPLGEVLALYQTDYYPSIKANTKKVFDNTIKHLKPLHDVLIDSVSEYDILEIASKIKRSGAKSVSSNLVQFTKRLFNYAKQEGYILENKLRDLKPTYSFKPREQYLQPKELTKFIQSLADDRGVSLEIKVAIYSLTILMLRRSELVEIKWCNVDLDSGRIVVERTKTINNFVMIVPDQIKSLWQLLGETNGMNELLFKFGDHALYSYITDLSVKYIDKRITPHDFRRTGMSLLAEKGHNYLVIDSALAHTVKGVNRSYLKSNLLDERLKLLQDYANYIDEMIGVSVYEVIKSNINDCIDSIKRSITQ